MRFLRSSLSYGCYFKGRLRLIPIISQKDRPPSRSFFYVSPSVPPEWCLRGQTAGFRASVPGKAGLRGQERCFSAPDRTPHGSEMNLMRIIPFRRGKTAVFRLESCCEMNQKPISSSQHAKMSFSELIVNNLFVIAFLWLSLHSERVNHVQAKVPAMLPPFVRFSLRKRLKPFQDDFN